MAPACCVRAVPEPYGPAFLRLRLIVSSRRIANVRDKHMHSLGRYEAVGFFNPEAFLQILRGQKEGSGTADA